MTGRNGAMGGEKSRDGQREGRRAGMERGGKYGRERDERGREGLEKGPVKQFSVLLTSKSTANSFTLISFCCSSCSCSKLSM